jgi:predicted DNA-binding transcriptional regulator AlpA
MQNLLKVKEAAAIIGLSASTMNKMRCTGRGPRFYRIGKRRIGYALADLMEWLSGGHHTSTAEYIPDEKRA